MDTDLKPKIIDTIYGKVRYSITGEGMPIIIAHGSGGGDDQGQLIAERFFPPCKAISVCRFGYAESEMPKKPNNKKQASVYKAIMDFEGIQTAHIVGLSAGGPSAIEFAIEYPTLCSSLTLISALGVPTLNDGVKIRKVFTIIARTDFFVGLLSLFVRKRNIKSPKKVVDRLYQNDDQFLGYAFKSARFLRNRIKGVLNDCILAKINPEEMKNISCPTLVIHATDDGLVSSDNADYAASTIPQAVKLVLHEGGHLLLTQHDRVKAEISRFLENIGQNHLSKSE